MGRGHQLGFWFAYIETLTALAVIFLILFVFATNRERIITEQTERLVESWQIAVNKLIDLNAAPVHDPTMGGMRVTLADSIIFAVNSDELSREGENIIIEISKILNEVYLSNPWYTEFMRIIVGGHTDRIGGDDINFPLSYRRAKTVSDIIEVIFLTSDIDASVMPIAYGSKYPLPGHYAEREPRNRRITIVVELLSTELFRL